MSKQKIFFMVFGIIIAMIVLEVSLRIAGFVYKNYRIHNTENRDVIKNHVVKILCIGDSFTFGEGAPKGFSYPEQLQKILDSHQGGRYAVYNAGISGQNSSRVLKDLEDNIYKYKPDIVVMLAGCNNTNNFVDSNYFLFKDESLKTYIYRADALLSHMRSYKLFKSAVVAVNDNIARRAKDPCKNKLPEPQKDIKDASAEYSMDAERHVEAARAYEADRKIGPAINECRKAIELDLYNEKTYFLLGFIYLHRCPDWDEKISLGLAIENFKKAIRIDPLNEEFHQNLFNAYYRVGEKDKAMEELEIIHALNPDNEMINVLLVHGLPEYKDINVFKMTLAYDLRNIIRSLSAKNIRLILQTYPASWANDILKETAKVNKIALVDNQAVFEERQAAHGYRREDYFAEDGHCNINGYNIIAENIYNTLCKN